MLKHLMKYMVIITLTFIVFTHAGCYYDKPVLEKPDTCDTTNITYSGSIIPILSAHCVECHSQGSDESTIKLDAYATVRIVVDNGKILGAITHATGYSPMPKEANKLSDCDIAKIREWIADGAKNN